MDPKALFKINCGLFLVGVNDGAGQPSGCIINTVMQVSHSPVKCSMTIGKDHYTNQLVMQTGTAAITALPHNVPPAVIKRFGFSSGRTTRKFDGIDYELDGNQNPYLPGELAAAVLALEVYDTVDVGTHTIFLCNLQEAKNGGLPAITYNEYLENVKKGMR